MQRLDAAENENTKLALDGTAAARIATSRQRTASPHQTSVTRTDATAYVIYNSEYEGVFAVSSVWLQFDVLFL